MLSNISKKELELFREKWGQFYYSDTIGMDWEKPKKQNVTGVIPSNHSGYCIASNDIEDLICETITQVLEDVAGEEEDTENFKIPKGEDIGVYRHCESLKRKSANRKRQEILDYAKNFKN